MPQYFYGVKDQQGRRQSGVVSAANSGEALLRLRDRFPLVLRLDQVGRSRYGLWGLLSRDRVTNEDLLAFTHQLAAMLEAGLSFGAAMDILLLDRVHRRPMRRVLVDLAASVSEGRTFSSALADHPQAFPQLYVSMIRAGESSANVPDVLKRLAEFLEKTARLKLDVLSALLYPTLVLIFGIFVATGTLLYGAPVLHQMYSAAGAQLPFLSRLFIQLGEWLRTLSPAFLAGLALAALVLPRLAGSQAARHTPDRLLITMAPTRDLLMEACVARSCRTLATLYGGGVPVLTALEMTAQTAGNVVLRDLFLEVREKVAAGSNLSQPLLASPLFPPMASGMITAGEAAGSLPAMLDHLADYYESRLDFALKAFTRLVEPVLVVIVGLLIGVVILALGLPFMNLVSVLS